MISHTTVELFSECLMLFIALCSQGTVSYCPPGNILVPSFDGLQFNCTQCPSGKFNPYDNGIFCQVCTEVDEQDPHLLAVAPCTPSQDTVVKCRDAQYFYEPSKKACTLCTVCEDLGLFVTRECSETLNSVCCPEKNMMFRDEQCVNQTFCSVKEKFALRGAADGLHDACEPCPLNTTNYEEKHKKSECYVTCLENFNTKNTTERNVCEGRELTVGNSCYKNGMNLCSSNKAAVQYDTKDDPSNDLIWIVSCAAVVVTVAIGLAVYCHQRRHKKAYSRFNDSTAGEIQL